MTARRTVGRSLLVIWIAALPILTARQSLVWTSDLTLWGHAVTVAPQKPRPWVNYAIAVDLAGDPAAATALYQVALEKTEEVRYPLHERVTARALADFNRGLLLWQQGDHQQARAILARLQVSFPAFLDAARTLRYWDRMP